MVDTVTKDKRSEIMKRVPQKDTKPELIVRKLVHGLGYRYRLHKSGLPGKPDLVFSGRKKVIFVNGCFWHGHEGCKYSRPPKSNKDYWLPKLKRNKERDAFINQKLYDLGWSVLTIWECELRDMQAVKGKVLDFLEGIESAD
ncbi:MAG: very short patch repair endonuclease [gamma proteobacterium symbiont of Stewartia floridana]|nr:MAG: very short patch repair endonuclease [gamma proteobacterium symbiont of Stewartia floridana]